MGCLFFSVDSRSGFSLDEFASCFSFSGRTGTFFLFGHSSVAVGFDKGNNAGRTQVGLLDALLFAIILELQKVIPRF